MYYTEISFVLLSAYIEYICNVISLSSFNTQTGTKHIQPRPLSFREEEHGTKLTVESSQKKGKNKQNRYVVI